MVTVTDTAKEELKRLVEATKLDPGKYLRLATPPVWVGEGDFGIVIDEQFPDDHAECWEGSKVLLVDADLKKRLPSAVLDFKYDPNGPRFTLDVY